MRLHVVTGHEGHRGCCRGYLLLTVLFLTGFLVMSCIGPVRVRKTQQSTIVDVNKAAHLTQCIGVILANAPQLPTEQKISEWFMATFLESMRHKNHRLSVISEKDEAFPDALKVFRQSDDNVDVFDTAEVVRRKGYQGVAVVRMIEQRGYTEDTGILWWRKSHHYFSFVISVDLYDPFTTAKIISLVKKKHIRISPDEYQCLSDEDIVSIEKFKKVVVRVAEDAGAQIAACMAEQPWKTTVLSVENGSVILASGGRSGIAISDRLVVYKARRVMNGLMGERFLVPGYKTGQLRVETMEGRFVRAVIEGQADDIKEGDLVIAQ